MIFGCNKKREPAEAIRPSKSESKNNQDRDLHLQENKMESFYGEDYELLENKNRNGKLDFKISFKGNNNDFKRDQPIIIIVELCNKTDGLIKVSPTMVPQDYGINFQMTDDKGKPVAPIGIKRRLVPKPHQDLLANECLKKEFNLTQLYVIKGSGSFEICAYYNSNWLNKAASKVKLESNQLSFKILP